MAGYLINSERNGTCVKVKSLTAKRLLKMNSFEVGNQENLQFPNGDRFCLRSPFFQSAEAPVNTSFVLNKRAIRLCCYDSTYGSTISVALTNLVVSLVETSTLKKFLQHNHSL